MVEIIQRAERFAQEKLKHFDAGHDFTHTMRVLNMAMTIREKEGAGDKLIIQLSAILHDIADTKFYKGSESDGGDMSYAFLTKEGLDPVSANHIKEIINNISFRKRDQASDIQSIEYKIVQDADRLDAMGAIGIARAFNYGGYKNRPLYNPEKVRDVGASGTISGSGATIDHFHEKLLLLKDLMNTEYCVMLVFQTVIYKSKLLGFQDFATEKLKVLSS